MIKPTFAYMIDFSIKVKLYKRLLSKYNRQYNLYNQFNLELLVMAYLKDNIITYPDCFGHKNIISFIHRRKALNWLVRIGYIESLTIKRYRRYKINNQAKMICRDFLQELEAILNQYQIKL